MGWDENSVRAFRESLPDRWPNARAFRAYRAACTAEDASFESSHLQTRGPGSSGHRYLARLRADRSLTAVSDRTLRITQEVVDLVFLGLEPRARAVVRDLHARRTGLVVWVQRPIDEDVIVWIRPFGRVVLQLGAREIRDWNLRTARTCVVAYREMRRLILGYLDERKDQTR